MDVDESRWFILRTVKNKNNAKPGVLQDFLKPPPESEESPGRCHWLGYTDRG